MFCPRCGATASGAECAECGESLAFAPPQARVDADAAPASPAEVGPPAGLGFLIAAAVIQILCGGFWFLAGVVAAAVPGVREGMSHRAPPNGDESAYAAGLVP